MRYSAIFNMPYWTIFFKKTQTMMNPKKMHHFISYSNLTNDCSSYKIYHVWGNSILAVYSYLLWITWLFLLNAISLTSAVAWPMPITKKWWDDILTLRKQPISQSSMAWRKQKRAKYDLVKIEFKKKFKMYFLKNVLYILPSYPICGSHLSGTVSNFIQKKVKSTIVLSLSNMTCTYSVFVLRRS